MSNTFGTDGRTLGIDAGASLCKLVQPDASGLNERHVPAGDWGAVRDCISAAAPLRIVATGGGAERVRELAPDRTVRVVDEFEAWATGVPVLARGEGLALPERWLLVSVGTGTSALSIREGSARRIGGTALGGGTLVGLGRLLCGARDHAQVVELAERGDRRKVDLLLRDIYPLSDSPLPPDTNASSFAKLDSREPADLAAALMWMVGENIGLICGALALAQQASAVVYCGTTLVANEPLHKVLRLYGAVYGLSAHLPRLGAYGGALGAALLAG